MSANDDVERIQYQKTLFAVVRYFKNASNFAKALHVKQSAVSQWLKKGELPELRCYQIEVYTCGRFKAEELLPPHLKPRYLDQATQRHDPNQQ